MIFSHGFVAKKNIQTWLVNLISPIKNTRRERESIASDFSVIIYWYEKAVFLLYLKQAFLKGFTPLIDSWNRTPRLLVDSWGNQIVM